VVIVPAGQADAALAALRSHPLGHAAALIGTAQTDPNHLVELETGFGSRRIVNWMAGEPLPRIC